MKIIAVLAFLYLAICVYIYLRQESFIFFPDILPEDYQFVHFGNAAEEIYYRPGEEVKLHALKFSVPKPKGVILYFHGNARALDNWGYIAGDLLPYEYDVIIPDYRGFGKSTGLFSEAHLLSDAQYIYAKLAKEYGEKNIVIYGRSLGSGIASFLASETVPKLLILETPYYSMERMAGEQMRFLPTSILLKYKFRSDLYLPKVTCPIHIFHGTEDELIPYQHAVDLKSLLPDLHFTTIPGASHNNLSQFSLFNKKVEEILGE